MADTGGRKRSGKFESPSSSGIRKRARGAVADDSFNSKSTNGNGTKSASTKHGKSQSTSSSDSLMVDRLVDVITRFNLYLNELFQLKEYGSLVEWNPSDFSFATNNQLPEIFQYFVDSHNYKLIWDESSLENWDSIPLRLQKKKLQEREAKLREKYPFMDIVLERSRQREYDILKSLEENSTASPEPAEVQSKVQSKVQVKKSIPESDEESNSPSAPNSDNESISSVDLSDLDTTTTYKLKQVVYTIPPPIITHPSHIPSWSPQENVDQAIHGDNETSQNVLSYSPEPLRVVSNHKETLAVPAVESKIENFLKNKFRAAIIDDSGIEVSNSPEEASEILEQQKHLLKRLYEKVMVEERFELNGDKIERRKIMLPNTNAKIMSDPFRDNGAVIPKIQGASNDQTYQDHFVAQGMTFSRIHQQMRRSHQARGKKVAQMIEQHFRKKAGEKERLAREREQNLRRISRLAIQAVKKRWSQANKVYRILQHQKEEELKQIEGREHLSKMLEHSTQLLEAQLNRSSRENTETESILDSDDDESSDEDSENFSSSSSESEKEDQNDVEADNGLTVAELKKKYAEIETASSSTSPLPAEENINGSLKTLDPNHETATVSAEYTEEQKKLIKSISLQKNDLLDSDEYSDSLSEGSSDQSSSSESENSDESGSEMEDEPTSLAALYSSSGETKEEEMSDVSMDEAKDKAESPTDSKEESDKDEKVEEINGFKVKEVPTPPLLRGTLRPYQKQGLNWLASLYNNNTNGILADEMGLGKTIQTISLLAYLACEHHIWGPHLIIVPTSVMLNWEMEFKKFAPGFRVLTYYGSPQERARKRKGWNKMDAFHVCITSYQLVVHDHSSFKRKKWRYMILDEAHNIKNFRSARWRALLNFNTENRLLLTGTPLQNNLMELWSLLYFLMPSSKIDQMMPDGFANFEDFQQWFGKPVDKILEKTTTGDIIDENVTKQLDKETRDTVARLHQVLRPYLLRRLKKDVEKQMPGKYEHIVYCRLSKRQRYLYDDFMSRAKTKETLSSGNFLSIINCLMQLRKVCNHPDLFEVRPIVTSFAMNKSVVNSFENNDKLVRKLLSADLGRGKVNLSVLNFDITGHETSNYFACEATNRLKSTSKLEEQVKILDGVIEKGNGIENPSLDDILEVNRFLKLEEQVSLRDRLQQAVYLNNLRCSRAPFFGESFLKFVQGATDFKRCDTLEQMSLNVTQWSIKMDEVVDKFAMVTPAAVALDMKDQIIPLDTQVLVRNEVESNHIENPFHHAQVKLSVAFPDKQLLQYDCGKLQKLATLLHDLVANGHRALIFTQMTKVLDILEQFLNFRGYRYMRLDGATKIEDRQLMTEKFNRDPKIPVFILSTRSGGLGINLTGADTVIFYDSDWNPAMDKQCQDRCHRIGQMRDVHIYRFVSEYTIESNILKKANQKRQLDNVVIQEGDFTTDYLGKFSVRDLVNDTSIISDLPDKPIGENANIELLAQAEDEADRVAAKEAMKEVAVDEDDFNEDSKQGTPTPGKPKREEGDTEDGDYDEGVGHIDEYMLRYIGEGFYVE
ncbi:putative helicase [Clavispora lusitaniae]|uniref:Helicase n=1 Tax=Clavispora lusitaniae TaxID=36911 RepID=A0ACD0WNS5_CLALS|nr:putative helicase [Clavispora lusitaniae]QFZ34664.1 putative helicase [Clavispora lusitaniae]QFZ40349.1 putative helicase [Clavispora lusitaniae]QFZ46029.1 putative helicase [Clavispora lusitaniae]QFZ51691.1 putative helicase [Clavispora lusitaniae]